MSIKVSTHVWENSTQRGTALLLMLAIADHAHDDGGGAYPSIATLSRKARTTPRHVKRLLPQLVSAGELEIRYKAGPHGTNLYQVTICHPRFYDGSNDGSGDAQVTTKASEMSPPSAREFTIPPERDIESYLLRRND